MIFYLAIVFIVLIGAMISCPTIESMTVGIPLLLVLSIFSLIFQYNSKNKKNFYKDKKQVRIDRKKNEKYYNEFGELP